MPPHSRAPRIASFGGPALCPPIGSKVFAGILQLIRRRSGCVEGWLPARSSSHFRHAEVGDGQLELSGLDHLGFSVLGVGCSQRCRLVSG